MIDLNYPTAEIAAAKPGHIRLKIEFKEGTHNFSKDAVTVRVAFGPDGEPKTVHRFMANTRDRNISCLIPVTPQQAAQQHLTVSFMTTHDKRVFATQKHSMPSSFPLPAAA